MPEVLCIGHATFDISVFVRGYPAENSKGETDLLVEAGGGPAANAAFLLASWGVPVAYAGLVGDDVYGRRAVAELQSVGADVSLVERRPNHATPVSVIVVNLDNGSRTLVNRKASHGVRHLTPDDLAGMSPKVVLFDGHELQASLVAMEAFPNASSILDAGSVREGTVALAGKVTYLVAAERFARGICGIESLPDDAGRRACVSALQRRYGSTVVVTFGELGAIADDGSRCCAYPATPAQAIDTTAAGDVFHGAFAYAVARGMSFDETIRFASMTASLSVRKMGGRPSIPAFGEVAAALKDA